MADLFRPKAQPTRPVHNLVWVGMALLALVLLRSSWMGDDAYIMLRVVRNLVEGHGMVYNIGERVNPASDTLWALLLAVVCGPVGDYFVLPQLLNIVLTLGAVAVVVFGCRLTFGAQLLFIALVLSSKAFIDYATAGLENALMYFLAALLMRQTLARPLVRPIGQRQLFYITLLAALLALCRPDAALLAALPVAYAYGQALWRQRTVSLGKALGAALLGGLPFLAWYAFSLVYYGLPFPNTYYAKVLVMRSSHIARGEVLLQGVVYYISLLEQDLATVLALVLALVLARRATAWERVWLLTTALYLGYIVSIGGDFMSGRFFAVPALMAAVLLARRLPEGSAQFGLAGLALLLACLRLQPVYAYGNEELAARDSIYSVRETFTRRPDRFVDARGIAEERLFYGVGAGLVPTIRRHHVVPLFGWYGYGERAAQYKLPVASFNNVGMFGFAIGRKTYVVDPFGLTDNFLARLSSPDACQGHWRIGHFTHVLPAGFLESKITGTNQIRDPRLARLYEATQLLARGPLFTKARWQAIVDINTGVYDRALAGYCDYAPQDTLRLHPAFVDFSDFKDPRAGRILN